MNNHPPVNAAQPLLDCGSNDTALAPSAPQLLRSRSRETSGGAPAARTQSRPNCHQSGYKIPHHTPKLSIPLLSLLLCASASLLAGRSLGEDGRKTSAADLPSGPGLAKDFPADTNISSHQSVIFADNFEANTFPKPWDSARDDDGDVLSFIDPADPRLGKRALRVTATLGKNTGGGPTKWFKSAETLFIRFYCRFDKSSDYIHHFVTLRANKSLQGKDKWSGFGGAGLRPKGDDRFSTALEAWGDNGRTPPPGRWNFYSYWPDMKRDPDGNFWGNAFRPATQPDIIRGTWICAEFMLKHNTPGKPDGQQAFWIDGQLRGHWKTINWRTSPTLWANALTLEAYVTDRWTKNKINIIDFDNLVIARSYIGLSPPAKP